MWLGAIFPLFFTSKVLGTNSLLCLLEARFVFWYNVSVRPWSTRVECYAILFKWKLLSIQLLSLAWRISLHCLWYSSNASANCISWLICKQNSVMKILKRHMIFSWKWAPSAPTCSTSFSMMLNMPIWARCRDSANLSSAWLLSQSPNRKPIQGRSSSSSPTW